MVSGMCRSEHTAQCGIRMVVRLQIRWREMVFGGIGFSRNEGAIRETIAPPATTRITVLTNGINGG